MKKNSDQFLELLDQMIPDPRCELKYNRDYELLIAVVLSAQSTDKRVNQVTPILFQKYDLKALSTANVIDIEHIIHSVGTFKRKSVYLKEIAKHLITEKKGIVPNDQKYLESLPGVGHKTANVVLSELFDVPALAVDTHVSRVSKRLGLAKNNDDVVVIEKKLIKFFPKSKWGRIHKQLVLFGRYTCKSQNMSCKNCLLKEYCCEKDKKL